MHESVPQKSTQEGEISHLPEILDGKEAKNLLDSARFFELADGSKVIAGTDKGIDYKDHNEDRVVVSPEGNFVAVVDGMGEYGDSGELAAEILSKSLLESNTDIELATQLAKDKMTQQGIGEGGAVFISALVRVEPSGKFLDISQLGDAKLIVIKKDRSIGFESKDHSLVQSLVDNEAITADQALYLSMRATVSSVVSPNQDSTPESYPSIPVEAGDIVLLMSDGISDNVTPEEIARIKQEHSLSAQDLFEYLSGLTNKRMMKMGEIIKESHREKDGMYSDGYKSKPKEDNRALVILEIK